MTEEPVHDGLNLEQIEGDSWGAPPPGATFLMTTVHELRRKPIGALTAEDLRVLIGQRVGLAVLVPRALDRLEHEPLLEGDFYPGDVLVAVLRVPAGYWSDHRSQLSRIESVIAAVEDPDPNLARNIDGFRQRTRSAR